MNSSTYAGKRPRSYVNIALVVINVGVFLYLEMNGSTRSALFMAEHGAAYAPAFVQGGKEYLRLITSIFMHFGLEHLVSNMIALFLIGDNLERAMGHLRYLFFYLLCGAGATACSLAWHALFEPFTVAAGASGAICGVAGALIWVVIVNRGRLEEMTIVRLVILVFYLLYSGFRSSGVDNIAHISGAILGFFLAWVLYNPAAGLIESRSGRIRRGNRVILVLGLAGYVLFLSIIIRITRVIMLG